MARLVAVDVLADHAADIRDVGQRREVVGEHLVELFDALFVAAHQLDQARHVLRHEPGVIPGGAFGEIGVLLAGIEGLAPLAVGVFGAHESDRRVEDVAPIALLGRTAWRPRFCRASGPFAATHQSS